MRALAILAAAAVVVSLFLPWLAGNARLSPGSTPWDYLRGIELSLDGLRAAVEAAPVEVLVLAAGFVLAAVFLVLAVVGLALRPLALLAGALPVGLVGYLYLRARDGVAGLGLPLDLSGNLTGALDILRDIAGPGLWAWGIGSLALLLAGLVGFGARR
ncbi:hypothetical protein [Pseudogemmobacter sonorensis]|uniref:hypothetical protein n=1 Tax=Pseudogemmobacter sonorensis TaxID=2989681 RepID=UPI0036A180D4